MRKALCFLIFPSVCGFAGMAIKTNLSAFQKSTTFKELFTNGPSNVAAPIEMDGADIMDGATDAIVVFTNYSIVDYRMEPEKPRIILYLYYDKNHITPGGDNNFHKVKMHLSGKWSGKPNGDAKSRLFAFKQFLSLVSIPPERSSMTDSITSAFIEFDQSKGETYSREFDFKDGTSLKLLKAKRPDSSMDITIQIQKQ